MIRKRDLGPLKFIAGGAVGLVYRVPRFTLPGLPPLAFKQVKDVSVEFSATDR